MDSMIFFITSRCNSKCRHCFYWKNLNKNDLPLGDIIKILKKLPKIDSILLSGGEPFLRSDIVEIISSLVTYNKIKGVGIPTNCINGDDILIKIKKIIEKHSSIDLEINCSLDGLKKEHDYIRGIPGNFEKTISLIKKIVVLKKKSPNLRVTVNTVITNRNCDDLKKLTEFAKTLNVDGHTFDIIRGSHAGILDLPSFKKLQKANKIRYQTRRYYNKKKPLIKRIFLNSKDKYVILTQQNVLKNKKWIARCVAGRNHITLESDGSLRICELHPKIGDLKEKTLKELLQTPNSKKIFNLTKNHKCDCTHICYLSSSINKSLLTILNILFIMPFKKI